jgi:hypothetical protein
MQTPVYLRAFLVLLCLVAATSHRDVGPFGAAIAQDDDDDGGGDDDDGGGGDDGGDDDGGGGTGGGDDGADDDDGGGSRQGGGSDDDDDDDDRASGGAGAGPSVAPRPVRQRVLPSAVAGELVTLALSQADLAVLQTRGYQVLEERDVPELNTVSRRLAPPPGTSVEEARDEVRSLAPLAEADFNHFYRTEQDAAPDLTAAVCEGPHCASFQQIGWTLTATIACTGEMALGVIDTGINPDHETFAASRLEVHKLTPGVLDPSRAIHGTAVTALLVGDQNGRSPGLLPQARVVAVDAFHSEAGDERADVYTLVAALDFLAAKGIRVVNMSLAGPPNAVLEETIAKLVARDLVLVAAAGNVGPNADPVYPAAYPGVLAVTAVDRSGTVYRRAGQGAHVDLAAPGVEVWTAASVRGARPKTGTSFAAPFVSAAAAAVLAAEPDLTLAEVEARLTSTARDLGDPGQDPVYGHGLVQAVPACSQPAGPAGDPATGIAATADTTSPTAEVAVDAPIAPPAEGGFGTATSTPQP